MKFLTHTLQQFHRSKLECYNTFTRHISNKCFSCPKATLCLFPSPLSERLVLLITFTLITFIESHKWRLTFCVDRRTINNKHNFSPGITEDNLFFIPNLVRLGAFQKPFKFNNINNFSVLPQYPLHWLSYCIDFLFIY